MIDTMYDAKKEMMMFICCFGRDDQLGQIQKKKKHGLLSVWNLQMY